EGHHEYGQEHHRRDGAHPVEVAGHDAVLGAGSSHADDFLSAEVGGEESQARDPGGNGAARHEEVGAALHIAFEDPPDADDEGKVDEQNSVVDPAKLNMHIGSRWSSFRCHPARHGLWPFEAQPQVSEWADDNSFRPPANGILCRPPRQANRYEAESAFAKRPSAL